MALYLSISDKVVDERSYGIEDKKVTVEMRSALERRIVIAQSLYAFGALLCVINTYVSIAFIVLVQLNYVIAPRFGLLERL